jgi:hypothetical protein
MSCMVSMRARARALSAISEITAGASNAKNVFSAIVTLVLMSRMKSVKVSTSKIYERQKSWNGDEIADDLQREQVSSSKFGNKFV